MSDAEKSTRARKTTGKTGTLVVQPHGGAIRNGGPNSGGPGRPSSAIKAAMRSTLDQSVLDDLFSKYQKGKVDALGFANFLARYGFAEDGVPKAKVSTLIKTWLEILGRYNLTDALFDEIAKATSEWEMKL